MFKIIFLPSHFHRPQFYHPEYQHYFKLCYFLVTAASFIGPLDTSFWTLWHLTFKFSYTSQVWGCLKLYGHILPKSKGSFSNWNQGKRLCPSGTGIPMRSFTKGPQALQAKLYSLIPSLPLWRWQHASYPLGKMHTGCQNDNLLLKEGTRFKLCSKKQNRNKKQNKTKNYSLEFIEEVEPPTNRPEAANFSERPTVSNTTGGGQARRWMAS